MCTIINIDMIFLRIVSDATSFITKLLKGIYEISVHLLNISRTLVSGLDTSLTSTSLIQLIRFQLLVLIQQSPPKSPARVVTSQDSSHFFKIGNDSSSFEMTPYWHNTVSPKWLRLKSLKLQRVDDLRHSISLQLCLLQSALCHQFCLWHSNLCYHCIPYPPKLWFENKLRNSASYFLI